MLFFTNISRQTLALVLIVQVDAKGLLVTQMLTEQTLITDGTYFDTVSLVSSQTAALKRTGRGTANCIEVATVSANITFV